MATEIGTNSVGAGHYLQRGRVQLPEPVNYVQNQAHGQLGG